MRDVAYRVLSLLLAASAANADDWSGQISAIGARRLHGGPTTERGIELRPKYADDQGSWSVRMEGRLRTNDQACVDDSVALDCTELRRETDWREFYVARQAGEWRWAAGWQQTVWGRADNLRVLDLINPVDLRDFVLPDLNDYRRAVPMLKLNGQAGDWTIEAVYLPVFVPNRQAPRGGEFYLGIAEQFAAQSIVLLPERRPAQTPRNGELGLLLSTSRHQVDWSVMALSTRNDEPVYRLGVEQTSGDPVTVAEPQFLRYNIAGASVAASVGGGWATRAEVTWSPDTPYSASTADDGIIRAATLTGLIGLDYSWREWLFTGQLADRRISGWRPDFLEPQYATTMTLSATATGFSGKLATRLAMTAMQHGEGTWWQSKFTYNPDDAWAIETTLDVLDGDAGGFFGQFRDRDRLRLELKRFF